MPHTVFLGYEHGSHILECNLRVGGEANEVEQLRQRVAQLEAELAQKNEELAQITKSRKSEQV